MEPGDLETANLARAAPLAESRLRDVLGVRALERNIVGTRIATWLGKVAAGARKMQRETPLSDDDIAFIQDASSDSLERAGMLIDRKQPRWLMGWRDITNATNERTVIASVFPRVGVNHKLPLFFSDGTPEATCALLANLSSITLDYAARQKLGGTSMAYLYFKQFPALAPKNYSSTDHSFLTPRVLELTVLSS